METQNVKATDDMNRWRIVPPQPEGPARSYLQRFMVKLGTRVLFVQAEEVIWIQSAANYVRLHCNPNSYTVRETMTRVESALDPTRFLRIHRNAIINLQGVERLENPPQQGMIVVMRGGTRLPVSRSYRASIRKMLRKVM